MDINRLAFDQLETKLRQIEDELKYLGWQVDGNPESLRSQISKLVDQKLEMEAQQLEIGRGLNHFGSWSNL